MKTEKFQRINYTVMRFQKSFASGIFVRILSNKYLETICLFLYGRCHSIAQVMIKPDKNQFPATPCFAV